MVNFLFFRVESIYDVNQIRELFKQGRFARCRSRFVVPVILYEGKVKMLLFYYQNFDQETLSENKDRILLCLI